MAELKNVVIPDNTLALLDQWRTEIGSRGDAHGARAKHFEGRARWISPFAKFVGLFAGASGTTPLIMALMDNGFNFGLDDCALVGTAVLTVVQSVVLAQNSEARAMRHNQTAAYCAEFLNKIDSLKGDAALDPADLIKEMAELEGAKTRIEMDAPNL